MCYFKQCTCDNTEHAKLAIKTILFNAINMTALHNKLVRTPVHVY